MSCYQLSALYAAFSTTHPTSTAKLTYILLALRRGEGALNALQLPSNLSGLPIEPRTKIVGVFKRLRCYRFKGAWPLLFKRVSLIAYFLQHRYEFVHFISLLSSAFRAPCDNTRSKKKTCIRLPSLSGESRESMFQHRMMLWARQDG